MRKCTVCNHPQRAEIELALLDGKSLRYVTKCYGMSHVSVLRHKRDHLPASLVAARQDHDQLHLVQLARHIQDRQQAVADHSARLLDQLDATLAHVTKVLDACDTWLTDPEDPTRYDLSPRASELVVHYTVTTADGKRQPRRTTLDKLLARFPTAGEEQVTIESVATRVADPRELILKAARRLESQVQLIAHFVAQQPPPPPDDAAIVVTSPEWIALRTLILAALDPYPAARQAVVDALVSAHAID